MIDETLKRLEERIRASRRTSDDAKRDLLEIVAQLRGELSGIEDSHEDDARTLAEQAVAAAEAAEGAQSGVEESVREFESAHPRIVGLVRSFMQTLADAGI